jgi:4a-hydroxytetrahydrobiopterin dehydratase
MISTLAQSLVKRRCKPCGVEDLTRLDPAEAEKLLAGLPGWRLVNDGRAIRREWRVKDFLAAVEFFRQIGEVAEAEDHHPDLHLTSYRNVAVEIWTHALGGLSENDFILAAKIDQVPVELKSP